LLGECVRPGGDRKSEAYKIKSTNGRNDIGKEGPNTASRLLRRLARPHPDILARYEAGEFKSVRAAAKEAGIVKDSPAAARIQSAFKKLNDEERREFIAWLKVL
jgi:hypothetical protein